MLYLSTHKSLRGPRGGIILLGNDYENPFGKVAPKTGRIKMISELLDSAVMPGMQGGPLMHVIAAKAVAFKEALDPSFKTYIKGVLDNAQCFAEEFLSKGYNLISGGTEISEILNELPISKLEISTSIEEIISFGKHSIEILCVI